MREEFHGNGANGIPTTQWKVLYGWGTINASVWLPGLAELVGIVGKVHETRGVYLSAMQEVNAGTNYWVDAKGGTQFAYFQQYNDSGGKQKIGNACNQQQTWLRSPDAGQSTSLWAVTSESTISWNKVATLSYAVHPAVSLISVISLQGRLCKEMTNELVKQYKHLAKRKKI